ncbi:hypothetical protein CYMTET_52672 [Cymbomonas tetramitiformis]|uniref:DDE-1 domain-containing protein n=1 Tax=Cymbomonas tetramitiformis TaxID=36881 RepID=A0AAE0BIJ9_9CHLO|nr:hypothetical protein CYMTET_52672 [Cymbomonas tetramitiformis]
MAAEEQAASVNAEGVNAGEHICGEPSGEPSGEAAAVEAAEAAAEAAVEAAAEAANGAAAEAAVEAAAEAAVEAAENGEEADPANSARLNDKRMLLFCARKDWRRRWCKRFSVACRRRTNNKGKSKGDRAPADARGRAQCRLALIFRGLGQRITALEKESWDERVDVYFQANAWADRDFCLKWLERTYGPWAETIEGEKILLMDNLDGQVHLPFRTQCKERWNTLAWYFTPNCTDLLQPVDRHFAQYLKTLIAAELELWLEDDDNLAKWESGQFTASERRVLLTHWCGKAWDKVCKMDDFIEKSFKGAGCLLTADMSELEAVAPQNMPGYSRMLAAELRKDEEKCDSSDGGENALDSDNEADVASDSDDEDSAPFFVPAGMSVQDTMPALDKTLVKTPILFKWVARGWQLGRVKKKLPRNDAGFNFKVYYGIDDRKANHCLSEERYVGGIIVGSEEEVADGSWVALRK